MVRVSTLFLILVAILSNQAALAQQCARWTDVRLVEEWRYHPPENASPDRLIGRVAWADRDERGFSYVLDDLNHRIVILDSAGNFVNTVGREGSGPGEFRKPRSVRVFANGGLAVLDEGLGRVEIFSADWTHARSVVFPNGLPSVRDFLVLDSMFVVSGVTAASEAVVHVYDAAGNYVRGLGRVRTDLREPILVARYSDGALDRRPDGSIVFARRTPFQLQVFALPSGENLLDVTRPDVIPDYVHRVATQTGEGWWRFDWRHPALTSVIALPDGCYLALVQELPSMAEDLDPTDYRTAWHVLDANGAPVGKKTLDAFVWATKYWRDAKGDHLLAIGLDPEPGGMFPVQYRIDGAGASR